MTEIALDSTLIKMVFPDSGRCEVYTQIAAEDIVKGEALYILAAGTVGVADGNVDAKDQGAYVALTAAVAGRELSCLKRGAVAGFTVAAVNAGTVVNLSDTAGDFQINAGDDPVGRVVTIHGKRVIYFHFFALDDNS